MTVYELSDEQKYELKGNYLCEHNESVSWGELLEADFLVSDEEIYNEYANYIFVNDDFFCSAS